MVVVYGHIWDVDFNKITKKHVDPIYSRLVGEFPFNQDVITSQPWTIRNSSLMSDSKKQHNINTTHVLKAEKKPVPYTGWL